MIKLLLAVVLFAGGLAWLVSRESWMYPEPFAVVDLVETDSPELSLGFVAAATRFAEEVGGRMVVANEAVQPMIVPDAPAMKADRGARLLVITQYPTTQAGERALANRQEREPDTGLYQNKWTELLAVTADEPIWMLNFLEFSKEASYHSHESDAAPATPISGRRAYGLYGRGMIRSLAAVGGRVGWSGTRVRSQPGTDDGRWHQIAIAVYPSATAMMTMLARPDYRAAHVHRIAGVARTRLLATQPIKDL